MDPTTDSRDTSSTRFEVVVSSWEAGRMMWVETPALVERATGRKLFAFNDERWSLIRAVWRSEIVVELRLRKYPGSHSPSQVSAVIDCAAETAEVGGVIVTLASIESALESVLVWPQHDPPATSNRFLVWIRNLFGMGRV